MFGIGNFLPSFIFNVAQGKDPLEATQNAMIDGTIGSIAGQFSSAIGPNFNVPQFGAVQNAANVPSLLTNSQGIVDAGMGSVIPMGSNAGYLGPTSMMETSALTNPVLNNPSVTNSALNNSGNIMPSYMDTSGLSYDQIAQIPGPGGFEPYVTTGRATNPLGSTTARTDIPQLGPFNAGPDMSKVITPEVQDLAKAGGFEEVPLYKQASDKIIDYVKDKPLESAFMAMTVGGGVYEGMKEPEQQIQTATLGPRPQSNFKEMKGPIFQVHRSQPIKSRLG